jgi:hypothetical protein
VWTSVTSDKLSIIYPRPQRQLYFEFYSFNLFSKEEFKIHTVQSVQQNLTIVTYIFNYVQSIKDKLFNYDVDHRHIFIN